jgi:hypothetical protein
LAQWLNTKDSEYFLTLRVNKSEIKVCPKPACSNRSAFLNRVHRIFYHLKNIFNDPLAQLASHLNDILNTSTRDSYMNGACNIHSQIA